MTTVVQRSSNGLAVAGFVLGIVAVAFSAIPHGYFFAVLPALLAIIFGFVGISSSQRVGRGRKRAVWAVVLGFFALLFPFVFAATTGLTL